MDIISQDDDNREVHELELDGEHLILVVVRPVELVGKNIFGQPLYSSLSSAKVIDAADIIDVVGRVPDTMMGENERWTIVQRPGTISQHDLLDQADEGSYLMA